MKNKLINAIKSIFTKSKIKISLAIIIGSNNNITIEK